MLLVTGGAGFVGARVVARARERGVPVRAIARRTGPGIDYVADLADATALQAIPLEDVTGVVHCAAAIPARSQSFARDNAGAAAVLRDALRRARALRHVVHVSSVSVYQAPAAGAWTIDEAAPLVEPSATDDATYAQSKRATETALEALRGPRCGVTQLRASSVYGRGMTASTLLPALTARARAGEPLVLRGPRGYVQNFIHVDDVADLALAAAEHGAEPVLNAFSDDTLGLFELARLVHDRLGSTSAVVDETSADPVPRPTFVNARARLLLRGFRALRDHLEDAA